MTLAEMWGVIASSVAAFGTILASVVALYLARQSSRVKLKAFIGVRKVILGGKVAPSVIVFDVTNTGERQVTIEVLGWRVGRWPKRRQAIVPNLGRAGPQTPKALAHGERVTFIVAEEDSGQWLSEYLDGMIETRGQVRTLRGCAHTSVGHVEVVAPEQALLDGMRKGRPKRRSKRH